METTHVSGVVFGRDGQPLRLASCRLVPVDPRPVALGDRAVVPTVVQFVTDADGMAAFEALPGLYVLEAPGPRGPARGPYGVRAQPTMDFATGLEPWTTPIPDPTVVRAEQAVTDAREARDEAAAFALAAGLSEAAADASAVAAGQSQAAANASAVAAGQGQAAALLSAQTAQTAFNDLALALATFIRPDRIIGGVFPTLDFDFLTGVHLPGTFGTTITFTRAGTGTRINPFGEVETIATGLPRIDHDRVTGARRGLLVEDARTNLFLQSGAPATQTVSGEAAQHALSFYGTGTITLSGAHSATLAGTGANARAVLIFTPSAGALTLTVAGSVQLAQLEAGNCATSYIPTTTAPVTRARDVVSVPVGPWWNPDAGSMLVEWQDINQQSGNTRIIGMPGLRSIMSLSGGAGPGGADASRLEMFNGANNFAVILGADITKGIRRGVAVWSAAGRSLAISGQTAESAAPLVNTGTVAELYLGSSTATGGLAVNGCLRRVTYWPRRLGPAEILQLAT